MRCVLLCRCCAVCSAALLTCSLWLFLGDFAPHLLHRCVQKHSRIPHSHLTSIRIRSSVRVSVAQAAWRRSASRRTRRRGTLRGSPSSCSTPRCARTRTVSGRVRLTTSLFEPALGSTISLSVPPRLELLSVPVSVSSPPHSQEAKAKAGAKNGQEGPDGWNYVVDVNSGSTGGGGGGCAHTVLTRKRTATPHTHTHTHSHTHTRLLCRKNTPHQRGAQRREYLRAAMRGTRESKPAVALSVPPSDYTAQEGDWFTNSCADLFIRGGAVTLGPYSSESQRKHAVLTVTAKNIQLTIKRAVSLDSTHRRGTPGGGRGGGRGGRDGGRGFGGRGGGRGGRDGGRGGRGGRGPGLKIEIGGASSGKKITFD